MCAFKNILFPESSSRYREYRDCVCLWDPLPQHRQRHPTELHQVCTFPNSVRRALNHLMPLFLNRYVEHDTLIWEYLNSSIHLVSFHLDFEIFWNSPRHLIHLNRLKCYNNLIQGPLLGEEVQKDLSRGRIQVNLLFTKMPFTLIFISSWLFCSGSTAWVTDWF